MRPLPLCTSIVVLVALVGCAAPRETSVFGCHAPAGADERDRWRTHLNRQEDDGFSGAVLVAEREEVLFSGEYGDARADSGPTAFWIASISKLITATAVLRLVEDERLDLHEPIATYVSDVPDRWSDVTIHHLLGHRAGFSNSFVADGIADRDSARKALLDRPRERALGTYAYSNDGYILLAILIEAASGKSYEDYVRRVVLDPAGMDRTGFWGVGAAPRRVAPPGTPEKTKKLPESVWQDGRPVANWGYRGATGMYATPRDLHRFVTALRDGRLLEPATVTSMLSPNVDSVPPNARTRGYGWALQIQDGQTVSFWHGGVDGWLGHNGGLRILGDRTYIVLTNSGPARPLGWPARIEFGLRSCADSP